MTIQPDTQTLNPVPTTTPTPTPQTASASASATASTPASTTATKTATTTLPLLTPRLHRLTYLLTGDTSWTGTPTAPPQPATPDETVARRIATLEAELERLSRNVPVVRDVLGVYARFPDLFQTSSSSHSFSSEGLEGEGEGGGEVGGLSTQTLASIVLSYATAFPETASRLTSLKDLPVPDAQSSAALVRLLPRLERLARLQDEQAREISELRVRTARVLQRWYEVSVLGGGECWAEWEGRLEDVEREVRRAEMVRERRANDP